MVLVMTPALEGLKPQWAEAAENLGASRWQYWRLRRRPGAAAELPRLGAAAVLLVVLGLRHRRTRWSARPSRWSRPQIDAVLSGNVLSGQENLGAALALDMIVDRAAADRRSTSCCSAGPRGGWRDRHRIERRRAGCRAAPAAGADRRAAAPGARSVGPTRWVDPARLRRSTSSARWSPRSPSPSRTRARRHQLRRVPADLRHAGDRPGRLHRGARVLARARGRHDRDHAGADAARPSCCCTCGFRGARPIVEMHHPAAAGVPAGGARRRRQRRVHLGGTRPAGRRRCSRPCTYIRERRSRRWCWRCST